MKKILLLILCCCTFLSLTACTLFEDSINTPSSEVISSSESVLTEEVSPSENVTPSLPQEKSEEVKTPTKEEVKTPTPEVVVTPTPTPVVETVNAIFISDLNSSYSTTPDLSTIKVYGVKKSGEELLSSSEYTIQLLDSEDKVISNIVSNGTYKVKVTYNNLTCEEFFTFTLPKPKKSNFFDYNGKLHVDGNYIKNQYDEIIQLNGVNCPVAYNCHEVWRNLDRFDLLKEWGFNLVRFGLSARNEYTPELMETYYMVLDHFIELGMYVEIVSFNDDTKITSQYYEKTKEFLTTIVSKYKDVDNFIYCVGNEPSVGITMSDIDTYSKALIEEILKYKSDAVIAVPTPYACSEIDDAGFSTIDYTNTIFVVHCYLSKSTKMDMIYRRIQTAIAFKKCLYFSEWSASSPSAADQYVNINDAANTAYIINKYKFPNAYYNYFPGGDTLEDTWSINPMGMIKRYYWDNTDYRKPEALTIGGNFAVNNVKNPINYTYGVDDVSNYTLINNGVNNQYYFWNEKYRLKIEKVIFDTLDKTPTKFVDCWSLTATGLGDLMSYIVENDNKMYTLLILADKKIYFPENSGYFFNKFSELKSITFKNIDTSNVTNMKGMFTGCSKLESLDLKLFNTSNVTNMNVMFGSTTLLEELDLSNFDTSKVENTGYMFFSSGIKKINMKNCSFTNVTESYAMFAGANPDIIVSDQVTKDFILAIKNSLKITIEN